MFPWKMTFYAIGAAGAVTFGQASVARAQATTQGAAVEAQVDDVVVKGRAKAAEVFKAELDKVPAIPTAKAAAAEKKKL